MEVVIINKPAMRLIDLATNVTLYDVEQNRTTLKLAANFSERRVEVKNCINERGVFGVSTDPEEYNPETDPFENAGEVHAYLYSAWLKQSGYELAGRYNIEIYDERNHGPESEESVTDICFPVRKK
jgi:AraC family transcriptional regulator